MKFCFLFILIGFTAFGQTGYHIESFEQYKKVFEKPENVFFLSVETKDNIESELIKKSELKISLLTNLYHFQLQQKFHDSILEAEFISDAGELEFLEKLTIDSPFKLKFQGFQKTKELILLGNTPLNNPHFNQFSSVANLVVRVNINQRISDTLEILKLPNIEGLELYNLSDSVFPFNQLGNLKNRLIKFTLSHCSLRTIPQTWDVISFWDIYFHNCQGLSKLSSTFCIHSERESQHILMEQSEFTDVDDCLLKDPEISLDLRFTIRNKQDFKLSKKLKRRLHKENQNGKRTYGSQWMHKQIYIGKEF